MLDEEGNEVRRELTGAWAEARAKLDASVADLMEAAIDGLRTLRLEPTRVSTEEPIVGQDYKRHLAQRRATKALDCAIERCRVATRYLDMGEPAMAANEVICATAYFALACMPNATNPDQPEPGTWSAAVDDAQQRRAEGPWVRALRTATEQIRALHPSLATKDVRVPAAVEPPTLKPGPGRMRAVGDVAPRALEPNERAFRAARDKQREDEELQRAAGKPVRPRRRT